MAGMTAAARQPGYSLTENGWRTLLLSTSVIILAFTVYCLSQGITIIFMHLYYFPIVLLAYHYHKKGVILSAVLGLLYVALVIFFAFPDMEVISGALVRFVVFIDPFRDPKKKGTGAQYHHRQLRGRDFCR
jgi:cell division protein FtsW (lipid II flippase)